MKDIPPVFASGNTDPSTLGMLKESTPNPLKIKIEVQVIFGSPSRTCLGSGVCRILPQNVKIPESWPCPVWKGELHWLASTGSFLLSLPIEQFTSAEINQWFSEGRFVLEEPFPIPLWLGKLLGENQYAIQAGSYPYEIQNNLTINLKMTKRLRKQHQANRRLLRGA